MKKVSILSSGYLYNKAVVKQTITQLNMKVKTPQGAYSTLTLFGLLCYFFVLIPITQMPDGMYDSIRGLVLCCTFNGFSMIMLSRE